VAGRGPAPDPNALRRDRPSDQGEWTLLPTEGRAEVPGWPLVLVSAREAALWALLWDRPQALMWARNGQELEVALFVRRLAEAEAPGAPVTLSTLVRQMGDSLGLTTPGLRANRWRIVADEPAPFRPAVTSIRSRARLNQVRSEVLEQR
jgi:hypothetical protein